MKLWLLSMVLVWSTAPYALEDTLNERKVQAARYLAANPPQVIFTQLAEQASQTVPEADRQPYTDMLTKYLDLSLIETTMLEAMIQHFTASELSALADFYSNPAGKDAMSKMSDYMQDVLPVVQTELLRAQSKAFSKPPLDSPQVP